MMKSSLASRLFEIENQSQHEQDFCIVYELDGYKWIDIHQRRRLGEDVPESQFNYRHIYNVNGYGNRSIDDEEYRRLVERYQVLLVQFVDMSDRRNDELDSWTG